MIAVRVSPRAVYQGRPVLVAASLADLRGPTSGVVELPLRLYWSAPDRTFSLDDPAERRKVYTIVVREARRPDDLADFLDGDTLIAVWPDIFLPKPVRRAWEDEHPALRPASPLAVLYHRPACPLHHTVQVLGGRQAAAESYRPGSAWLPWARPPGPGRRPPPRGLNSAATGQYRAATTAISAAVNIAYELARHRAGTMSDAEERATFFPICENKAAFEKFFQHPLRSNLYGDTGRRALQCVQPFAPADEMREHGVEPSTDPKSDLLTDHAYALNTIWNIDKHRRLPELAWAAEGPVWFEEVTGCRWLGHVSGVTLLPDGGVLGELHGPAGSGRPQAELHYTIDLVLTDDPSPYPSLLVERLEWLHKSLTGWVVPRIFIVADGNPPPMMIGGGG